MRQFFIAICFVLFATHTAAGAAQTTCSLSPSFSLLKEYNATNPAEGYSWTITYRGRPVYEFNASELKDIFGGQAVPADCRDILVNADNFAFRVGWKQDLLVATEQWWDLQEQRITFLLGGETTKTRRADFAGEGIISV